MHESTGQRLSRGLYSLATRIALPFSLYYLIWRGLRQREYFDRWSERFAFYQGPGLEGCVWLHAVSVGEVNAAVPLVAALRRHELASRLLEPGSFTPEVSAFARDPKSGVLLRARFDALRHDLTCVDFKTTAKLAKPAAVGRSVARCAPAARMGQP